MTLISVLTVIYNPGQEAFDCVAKLTQIAKDIPLEIIVVDNNSAKNNLISAKIQNEFPSIKFIHSNENLGFGGGNNLAFRHSTGDFILCINPDLMMTTSALNNLLTTLSENQEIGIIGAKTYDEQGTLVYTARLDYSILRLATQYLGFNHLFPTLLHGNLREKMTLATEYFEADWLQGSCLLMSRSNYSDLNGFDENFFLYMEDTDVCLRTRQAGLKVVYEPSAEVTHIGGATTAKFHKIRVKSFHHSPIHYHRKQGHYLGVIILKIIFTIELSTKIIARSLLNLLQAKTDNSARIKAEKLVLSQIWFY